MLLTIAVLHITKKHYSITKWTKDIWTLIISYAVHAHELEISAMYIILSIMMKIVVA